MLGQIYQALDPTEYETGLLPLHPLERFPSFLPARLLALDHPRVARQQARRLQRRSMIRIIHLQRARDAQPDRARLAAQAAAGDGRPDVEGAGRLRGEEGLDDLVDVRGPLEVLDHVSPVDAHAAVAREDPHSR